MPWSERFDVGLCRLGQPARRVGCTRCLPRPPGSVRLWLGARRTAPAIPAATINEAMSQAHHVPRSHVGKSIPTARGPAITAVARIAYRDELCSTTASSRLGPPRCFRSLSSIDKRSNGPAMNDLSSTRAAVPPPTLLWGCDRRLNSPSFKHCPRSFHRGVMLAAGSLVLPAASDCGMKHLP